MRTTTRLRNLLLERPLVVAPGAYDALSARLIEASGFPSVYMSGGGAACSILGQPDIGLLGLSEMAGQAARISAAISTPVVADCDTGFGNAMNVIRAVQEYERAGVAGLHLEDQEFPKRCGHLPGKQVVPAAELEAKIRAAVRARQDSDLVLIARTDARGVHGLANVLDRVRRYAAAGADMVFPEGLLSIDEVAAVADSAGIPVLINQVPGGQSPVLPHRDLAEAGCRMVIYPSTALSSSVTAMEAALARLADGDADAEGILAPHEIFRRVGLDAWQELMEEFGVPTAAHAAGSATRNNDPRE